MGQNAISTASLIVKTDGGQLDTGIAKAKGAIKGLFDSIPQSGFFKDVFKGISGGADLGTKQFGPIGTAVGGVMGGVAAGIVAATGKVHDFLAAFKQTNLVAKELGIGIEAFTELKFSAEKSGAPIEVLEQGMKHFVNTLATAKTGSKEALGAFASIGVQFNELKGTTTEEAFLKTADAISQIKDPTDQAAAAMQVFGERAGIHLANLMKQGSAGIKELAAEGRKLGVVINEADAQKLRDANAAMGRINSAVQGLVQDLAVALAPAIEGVSIALKETAIFIREAFESAQDLVKQFILGIADMVDSLEKLGIKLKSIKSIIEDVQDGLAILIAKGGEKIGILPQGTSQTLIGDSMKRAREDTSKLSDDIRKLAGNLDTLKGKAPDKNGVDFGKLAADAKLMNDALSLVTKNPLDKFEENIKGLDLLLKAGRITWDEYGDAVLKSTKALVDASGIGEVKTAGALAAGSKEATSAIIKSQLSAQVTSPTEQLKNAIQAQTQIQEQHKNYTKELVDVVKNRGELEGWDI